MKSSLGGIVGQAPPRPQENFSQCSRVYPRAESDVVYSPSFDSSAVSAPLALPKDNDKKYTNHHVKHQNLSEPFLPVWSISTARDGLPSSTVGITLDLGPWMNTEHQGSCSPRIALSSAHCEQNKKLKDSANPSVFTDPSSLNYPIGQTPGPLPSEVSSRGESAIYSPASSLTLPMSPSSPQTLIHQQPIVLFPLYSTSIEKLPLSSSLIHTSENESCNALSHFFLHNLQPTVSNMRFAESLAFSSQLRDSGSNGCFPPALPAAGVAVENSVDGSSTKRRKWAESQLKQKNSTAQEGTFPSREIAASSISDSRGVAPETDAFLPPERKSSFSVIDMPGMDNRRLLNTTGVCRNTIATSRGSRDDSCKSVEEMKSCRLVVLPQSHAEGDYFLESSQAELTCSLCPPRALFTSGSAPSMRMTATHSVSDSSHFTCSPIIPHPLPPLSKMNCSENSCSAMSHDMVCVDGTSHREKGERKARSSHHERSGSTSDGGASKNRTAQSSCSATCDCRFSPSIQNDDGDSQIVPRLFSLPFRPSHPPHSLSIPFTNPSCFPLSESNANSPHFVAVVGDREDTRYKNTICGSPIHFVKSENSNSKCLRPTGQADVLLNVPDCGRSISPIARRHSSAPQTQVLQTSFLPKQFTAQQRFRAHQEVLWHESHLNYPRVKIPDEERNLGSTEELRRRLEQRWKQIMFGKSTRGYRHYRLVIEKIGDREFHNPMHPVTPRHDLNSSKRTFDRVLNTWRKHLHEWDSWHGEGCEKKIEEMSRKEWNNAKNVANESRDPYIQDKKRMMNHKEKEVRVDEVIFNRKKIRRNRARKISPATLPRYLQEGRGSTSLSRSSSCSSSCSASSTLTSEGQKVFGLLNAATLRDLDLCDSDDEAKNPPPISPSPSAVLSPSTTFLPCTPSATIVPHETFCSSSASVGHEWGSSLRLLSNEDIATNGSPCSSVVSTPLLPSVNNGTFHGMIESCSHPSTSGSFLPRTLISIAEDAFSDGVLPSESARCPISHRVGKESLFTIKNTESGDGKRGFYDRQKEVEEESNQSVTSFSSLHKNDKDEVKDRTVYPFDEKGGSEWCRTNSFTSTVPMTRPTSTSSLFFPPNLPSNSHELLDFSALDSGRNTSSEQFMVLDEGFYDGWSEANLSIVNPSTQWDGGGNRSARSIPSPSGSSQSHVHPYYSMYTSAASARLQRTSSVSSPFFGLLSPYSFSLPPQDGSAPSSRTR